MTYTLALGADMLLATVPDGADIEDAVRLEADQSGFEAPEFQAVEGCILTDDEPEDPDSIVWVSGNCGWIMDDAGRVWRFAIRLGVTHV